MSTHASAPHIDEAKVEEFMGRFVADMGAITSAPLVRIGDRLGLYRNLADDGPAARAASAGYAGRPRRRSTWCWRRSRSGEVHETAQRGADGGALVLEPVRLRLGDLDVDLHLRAAAVGLAQTPLEDQVGDHARDRHPPVHAVLENIDAEHPPSSPVILHGRAEIAAQLRDVTARDMEHRVTEAFVAGDKGALRVDCRYADGTRVACLATLELRDGLIVRQRQVQTWDS